MTQEISKSQRIREHLAQHPGIRNMEVVDALKKYGVTAADVANLKSQSKRRKQNAPNPAIVTVRPAAAPAVHVGGLPNISWTELEAGAAFVKAAGSVQRAQHLLSIIDQIKAC